MAAKFFTGLPLDGPDPECVRGFGESALTDVHKRPQASQDHSRTASRKSLGMPAVRVKAPDRFCNESPI